MSMSGLGNIQCRPWCSECIMGVSLQCTPLIFLLLHLEYVSSEVPFLSLSFLLCAVG